MKEIGPASLVASQSAMEMRVSNFTGEATEDRYG